MPLVPLLVIILVVLVLGAAPMLLGKVNEARADRTRRERLAAVSRLASTRLLFRLPEQPDRDFLIAMSADPAAAEANGWTGQETRAIETIFNNPALIRHFQKNELIACERATGAPIGTATFGESPYGPSGSRQVGIHVHPDHRGMGYGREIMAAGILLLQYSSLPAFVGTKATNLGLRRIMEQLGFEPEPGADSYTAPNGDRYDAVWYRCGSDGPRPTGLFEV